MSEKSIVKDTSDAIKGIAEAVPIYQDAISPAAKELGKALTTVAKSVHIALLPVSALVWGYEQIKEYISIKLAEKLKNTPDQDIITPKTNIAGPTLEALRFTGHEDSLREMYANLLATSMDVITATLAYPSFVEIIKQMTSDEAKLMKLFSIKKAFPLISIRMVVANNDSGAGGVDILRNFSFLGDEAGCENRKLVDAYLDNLCRLGLIDIPSNFQYTKIGIYKSLENHPVIKKCINKIEVHPNKKHIIERKGIRVTKLGEHFIKACVIDHEKIRNEINSSSQYK